MDEEFLESDGRDKGGSGEEIFIAKHFPFSSSCFDEWKTQQIKRMKMFWIFRFNFQRSCLLLLLASRIFELMGQKYLYLHLFTSFNLLQSGKLINGRWWLDQMNGNEASSQVLDIEASLLSISCTSAFVHFCLRCTRREMIECHVTYKVNGSEHFMLTSNLYKCAPLGPSVPLKYHSMSMTNEMPYSDVK